MTSPGPTAIAPLLSAQVGPSLFCTQLPLALIHAMAGAPKWVLRHADGSPYLTRHVLWGVDSLDNHDPSVPSSGYVHEIHTEDMDAHCHGHPWSWCVGIVMSGGYTERRYISHGIETLIHYGVGDCNMMGPGDYHSIVAVEPQTRTLFLVGREVSDWGFLVDGVHVPHREYFKRPDAQKMTHTEER